LDEQIFFLGTW